MGECYICSKGYGDFGMSAINVNLEVEQKEVRFEGSVTDNRGEMIVLCKECTVGILANCAKAVIEAHSPEIRKAH